MNGGFSWPTAPPALAAAMIGWLCLAASPATAGRGEHLRGFWGTEDACWQWRAGEPDTPEVGPYEITEQWIRRWQFYCFIASEARMSEAVDEWEMSVVCGEGVTPRRYHLELAVTPDDQLTMRWQMVGEPDAHAFGPLERCRHNGE